MVWIRVCSIKDKANLLMSFFVNTTVHNRQKQAKDSSRRKRNSNRPWLQETSLGGTLVYTPSGKRNWKVSPFIWNCISFSLLTAFHAWLNIHHGSVIISGTSVESHPVSSTNRNRAQYFVYYRIYRNNVFSSANSMDEYLKIRSLSVWFMYWRIKSVQSDDKRAACYKFFKTEIK